MALRDLGTTSAVTGWLMCTDNMPSGSADKLGDVLAARGGRTLTIKNTDAEDRLVMMGAVVLAVEEGVDAIIDIATLTGAVLRALGQSSAGLFGNDRELVGLLNEAPGPPTSGVSAAAGERVPQAARLRDRRHLQPGRSKGATGFGARLLAEVARGYTAGG